MERDTQRRRRVGVWAFALAVAAVGIAAVAGQRQWFRLPPNSIPWEAPDLTRSPGWFAHMQIGRLVVEPERCFAALGEAGVEFTPLQDRTIGEACGYTNVVRLDRSPIAFDRKATATCSLAVALTWYQHALAPLAEHMLGARVVRIEQLGTFACRNVNSEAEGTRSQHATANAIDIAGYVLSDRRVVSVARDWNKPTAEGRFLAEAHVVACRVFNGVLGPDYNRLHANHFHLDLGAYRVCR